MDYESYRDCPEAQELNLMNVWGCPQCSYQYEEPPGCNEAAPCPDCHVACIQCGESYDG